MMIKKINIIKYVKKFLCKEIARSTFNDENGELKIHEKIRLFDSDMVTDKIIKMPSITSVIKSLIENDNKFYLELSLNRCLYVL